MVLRCITEPCIQLVLRLYQMECLPIWAAWTDCKLVELSTLQSWSCISSLVIMKQNIWWESNCNCKQWVTDICLPTLFYLYLSGYLLIPWKPCFRTLLGREEAVRNWSWSLTRLVLVRANTRVLRKDGRLRETSQLTVNIGNEKIPQNYCFLISFTVHFRCHPMKMKSKTI